MANHEVFKGSVRPPGYTPESTESFEGLKIENVINLQELIERLRRTPLKDKAIKDFFPYLSSTFTFESVLLEELSPCALYVLRPQLTSIRNLSEFLLTMGIDIFNLSPEAALIEYTSGESLRYSLFPPVIEVSSDDGNMKVIVDGIHRILIAKELGLSSVNALIVEHSAVPLPVLPVSWEEVRLCEAVPPLAQKRKFRFSSLTENWYWILNNFDRFCQGFGDSGQISAPYLFYRDFHATLTLPK